MLEKMVDSEEIFFKYAFVCAEGRMQRGEMTPERYELLQKNILIGQTPSRTILQDSFPLAYKELEKLAKRMGKDPWDLAVVREYWDTGHNNLIEDPLGDYAHVPRTLRDFCKVNEGEVGGLLGNQGAEVIYGNEKKVAINSYSLGIKRGDKVRTHKGVIIEKVE
jgi:hypothetical protein